MGAGTNVQRRLAALHHLDAPWRPRDIEQREGRILRQGNLNQRGADIPLRDGRLVRCLYVADAGDQGPLHPAGDERADVGALRRRTSTAARSPTRKSRRSPPAIRRSWKRSRSIRKSASWTSCARRTSTSSTASVCSSAPCRPRSRNRQERIERLSADIATRDAHGGEEFSMTVGNRVYSGKGAREKAAAALTQSRAVVARRPDLAGAGRVSRIRDPEPGAGRAHEPAFRRRRTPAGAVHQGSRNLQGAVERGEPGRDDAEHRIRAARPGQGRGGRTGARRPRGKDAGGFSRSRRAGRSSTRRGLRNCSAGRPN